MDPSRTVVFSWDKIDLMDHIKGCEYDILWTILQKSLSPGCRFLEAGAGSGRWLAFLTSRGFKTVGIELDARAVERFALNFPNIQYDVGDVESLPYADASFDVVLSHGVLEHLIYGPQRALSEMHRILREEGIAIISVPHANVLSKIYVLKNRIRLRFAHVGFLRKLLNKKPVTYSVKSRKEYFEKLARNTIKGLEVRLQFSSNKGIGFYEYAFRIGQFLDLIKTSGLNPLEVTLEYSDHMLFRTFGCLVGYKTYKGVTLNWLGKSVDNIIPKRFIAGMIVVVAKKDLVELGDLK